MKKFIISFIFLFCSFSMVNSEPISEINFFHNVENSSTKDELAEFTTELIDSLQEQYNIYAYPGYGFSPSINNSGQIESIEMNFYAFMEVNIDKARALELMVLKKITQAIQSHETIRSSLKEFPFTSISLSIDFKNLDQGRKIYHDTIGTVLITLNKDALSNPGYVKYISYNSNNEKTVELKEPYEEALILNAVNLLSRSELAEANLITELFRLEKEHNLIISTFLKSVDGYYKNPKNIHFHCQHLSQNISMTYEESEIQGRKILYTLDGEQFPSDKTYTLYSLNLAGEKKRWGYLKSDSTGKLVTQNDIPLNQIFFAISDVDKGEQIGFVLKSKDEEECITAVFTPKPIESSWEDGARISLSFLNKEFSGYLLQGTGFKPDESLFLALNEQKDKTFKLKEIKANHDGSWNYKTPILPFHENFGEECVVALHRDQDKDMKMLTFTWGMGNQNK